MTKKGDKKKPKKKGDNKKPKKIIVSKGKPASKKPMVSKQVIFKQELPKKGCCTGKIKVGEAYTVPIGFQDIRGTIRDGQVIAPVSAPNRIGVPSDQSEFYRISRGDNIPIPMVFSETPKVIEPVSDPKSNFAFARNPPSSQIEEDVVIPLNSVGMTSDVERATYLQPTEGNISQPPNITEQPPPRKMSERDRLIQRYKRAFGEEPGDTSNIKRKDFIALIKQREELNKTRKQQIELETQQRIAVEKEIAKANKSLDKPKKPKAKKPK